MIANTCHNIKQEDAQPRTLSNAETRGYSTPILSLFPPLRECRSAPEGGVNHHSWSNAYKCARNVLLESQRERLVAKQRKVRASFRNIVTKGEIEFKLCGATHDANNGKRLNNGYNSSESMKTYISWIEGIPAGQFVYPARQTKPTIKQPTTLKYNPPKRKSPNKKNTVDILSPWIDRSQETVPCHPIIENNEKCRLQNLRQKPPDNMRLLYLPHHR